MPTHKFVHTVSGVELTGAQKAQLNGEIAATVTRVLLGMAPAALNSDFLSEHPVCGGSHKREEQVRDNAANEADIVDPANDVANRSDDSSGQVPGDIS